MADNQLLPVSKFGQKFNGFAKRYYPIVFQRKDRAAL
jgi:hypothetical protein